MSLSYKDSILIFSLGSFFYLKMQLSIAFNTGTVFHCIHAYDPVSCFLTYCLLKQSQNNTGLSKLIIVVKTRGKDTGKAVLPRGSIC